MKANILNIQKTYSEIPGTWEFEGVTYQGYEHFTDLHFAHGWRDVVIPTITETQKLSNDFIFVDDIVTKEVIELNGLELQAIAEAENSKIALHEKYPEVIGMNWQLLQLDNLPGIERMEPISDKGLKGIKKYQKDGILIWSIETKFWFELDSTFPEGVIKTVKIYDLGERVIDQWQKKVVLSADDKEAIRKEQRERILSYFKSKQSEKYNFLYLFFKSEIDDYVQTGDKQKFKEVLIWAKDNHPYQDENQNYIVRLTLSQEIPTQSEGTTTVINGILDELV